MAQIVQWGVRWRVPFRSLDGVDYAVEIYDWGYSGEAMTLRGGPQPFVTQEDNTEDVFVPVRTQTGYVSVVMEDGEDGVLDGLLAENNRSRLVRLTHGSAVDWQGFLKCEAYSQPWEGAAHLVQLPVQSMGAALESVEMNANDTGIRTVARLLTYAMGRLLADDVADTDGVAAGLMGSVYVVDDSATVAGCWLLKYLDWRVFLQSQAETDNGRTETQRYGHSWREVLEAVCRTFGLTMSERGNDIYFTAWGAARHVWRWQWSRVLALAGGTAVAANYTGAVARGALPAGLELRGADNVRGLMQGAKRVKVVLSLTAEDGVMAASEIDGGGDVLEVKNMAPLSWGAPEVPYIFSYATETGNEKTTTTRVAGSGDYDYDALAVVDNGVLSPDNLSEAARNAYVTGALWVRWGYKDSETAFPALQPGLFLNQCYVGMRPGGQALTPSPCYSLESGIALNVYGGWLNIGMAVYNFYLGFMSGDSGKWNFGPTQRYDHTMILAMAVSLHMDGRSWQAGHSAMGASVEYTDGQWVADPGMTERFWLLFDNGELRTNKKEGWLTDKEEGYFVPIADAAMEDGETVYTDRVMRGKVVLKIWNVAWLWSNKYSRNWVTSPSRIITDLQVEYLPKRYLAASERNQNSYSAGTGVAFAHEKTVQLSVGTWNGNDHSACFLLGSTVPDEYVETMDYVDADGGTAGSRPEMHLLARLKGYYGKARAWTEATVARATAVAAKVWDYGGRKMMGVDAGVDWASGRKSVKFIEVNGDKEV